MKGEDEYLIGNCYTIDSFKILYAKDTIVLNYGSWKPVHYIETKLYISIPLYKTSNSNKYCIKYFADEEEWVNTCKIEPTNVVFFDDSFPMGVKSTKKYDKLEKENHYFLPGTPAQYENQTK